jgi:hypothetical protein
MGGCRYQVNHRPLAVSLTIKTQATSSPVEPGVDGAELEGVASHTYAVIADCSLAFDCMVVRWKMSKVYQTGNDQRSVQRRTTWNLHWWTLEYMPPDSFR